ncbi:Nucleotide-binding universal stress protein, UspA family [Formosa sp. Hel1_31_208]|uniref:universal stress protein n=1 Tax=Formosa sp. Hel1_31_208 TaxID=1798225 RepID=UPI00087AB9A4|nr:universal stress protein [Formosa sp. Hel1_31_208]SDR73490.1 Nucleotide-binding universal stress protein, UspA family [Formosa sp. Hel1_31_208]
MTNKIFKTIGIGVAFSPNLKANIYEAARLSLFFESKLVLIHVGEKSSEKEQQILNILQPFIAQGLKIEMVFQTGGPVDVISSISEAKKVDLLVLGALQKENFVQYYLGTIARKITRKANCSILLLIKPSVERIICKHIVVNGLNDPKTKQTISTAFYVSHKLQSKKITIVEEITKQEVAVSVNDDKSLRKSAIIKERIKMREDSRVKRIVSEIPVSQKSSVQTKTQSIFGKRGYSIGHYAQFVRADLLVMNAPLKTSFWDRLFPHDIEYILSELPTDVLIIR